MRNQKGNRDLKRHNKVHEGEKFYKCDRCSKTFTQKGGLKSHMECVHRCHHHVIYVVYHFVIQNDD